VVTERERRLEALDPYLDVRRRVGDVPRSARIRGFFFHNIEPVLAQAGQLDVYRAMFPETFSGIRWYPLGDYLVHLAVAGSLVASPERVHEGMEEIGRRHVIAISQSLIGRTLLRFLDREPRRLLEQGMAGRRQTTDYGRWELEFTGPTRAVMHLADEYMWLESALLGAAKATFESINVPVVARAELDSPYFGRHILEW